ncbi:MAG TPA: porin family protein [Saprospiraceae bacterium]|nr:PorT family protein [Saprospiraceae bacterium]HPG06547.1 porin family protein [Saprospiraceae bacterium]HRV83597.1 porin family protein [Saprospiraceae bacterium]
MKKAFSLTIALLLITTAVFSQISIRPQIGIKASDLSYGTIQGKLTGKSGYIIGLDFQFGHPFYFQPGLNINPEQLTIKNVGDVRITRVNIPVLVGFKLFEPSYQKSFGIRFFAGPNFAFKVNNTISGAINDISKEDFNQFTLSGIAGAGVDLSIFFLDLGYNFGLSDALSPQDVTGIKINYFLANAGLRIGF